MGLLSDLGKFVRGEEPPTPEEVHISQVGDEVFNAQAPGATANCGPASLIMALRLQGLPVPGEDDKSGEALIEHIRYLGTGSTDRLVGTTNLHLKRVANSVGASTRTLTHPKDMLRAVTEGDVVIMGGNPAVAETYTRRYDYLDIRRYDSGHWIVISRWNKDDKSFTVNDPQSVIGPINASVDELYAFNSKDGGVGLAIAR